MENLVQKLIQHSKNNVRPINARQIFFREFDRALQMASLGLAEAAQEGRLLKLMQYGLEAGLSAAELASRKKTLIWTLAQAA